ncbi:glycosyltransferase [Hymenobacter sp. BRD128]|uniref:glycosyltransferase n=1 Tax=Hymenobacter sp. BRD128 TaxID=2675878 RepID=UPI0015648945|nr:glycosyltransferase [Hymenobacter sp. BRD128]QKG55918.1 glycosyltransferase [Hymenobacter sp. BRD128]
MLIFLLSYCALWLLVMATATWRLAGRRGAAVPVALPTPQPRVSILVAARNEEAALPRCLASLCALDYPADLLEILIGDDASTDRTRAVAEAALASFAGPHKVLTIRNNLGRARGKANVLAHLARAAQADYLLITDADIAVPPTWVVAMLRHAAPGVGTVTGLTVVAGAGWLARLQRLDWLLSLALIQVGTEAGQPMTAMGNNMLITRAAYQATGGYEALPFSVTEDFALFEAVNARGFGFRQLFEPAVRATSLPAASWRALVQQRLRWLRGVAALPGHVQAGLVFFSGYWLAVLGLALVGHLGWALGALALKIAGHYALALAASRRAGLPRPAWWLLPLFESYSLALTTHLTLTRLLGRRGVEWKGRQYN